MEKRVLVVDDERAVREGFVFALDGEPYTVDTAASGEEGLEKAERERPDLIFLDLRMPGMDGVEVLRRLKDAHADATIYIVTAFRRDYMEALSKAASEGLQFQVMDKPLEDGQIRTIVRSVFGPPQSI